MNSKLKIFGIALGIGLIFMAVAAVSASAQFTSNKTHTIFSGSQKTGTNDIFTAGEGFGSIICETATFSGTATETNEPDSRIVPTYSNCKDSFGRTVDIDNGNKIGENTLTYTFTEPIEKKSTAGYLVEPPGPVDINGEMTLTVTSGGSVVCTVVIKNGQTNTSVTYTNLEETKGVEVTTHARSIISTTSGGFFNCGISNGEHTSGTYDGVAVITGKDTASNAAEISVDAKVTTVHCS
jgi:hypothetical protein